LLDPRIGRSHTQVYPDNRGYGGSCLPKDTAAIIYQGDQLGVDMRLLKATEEVNRGYHNE
jgi:Predicted UDP-glucose 6-dehydrogenase